MKIKIYFNIYLGLLLFNTSNVFTQTKGYSKSEFMQLSYGETIGDIGISIDAGGSGPISFAIKNNNVYIVDSKNNKINIYNKKGIYLNSIVTDASDILITDEGIIYTFNPRKKSIDEFDSNNNLKNSYKLPINYSNTLRFDKDNKICIYLKGEKYSIIDNSLVKDDKVEESEIFSISSIDRHNKVLKNNLNKSTFTLQSDKNIGTISFLGVDNSNNIYIEVLYFWQDENFVIQGEKFVNKYSPDFILITSIPILINDYAFHSCINRDLCIDKEGNVYHLRPLHDKLIIDKWTSN